ncbi:MAG: (2Fe-2S)-binding protein [SAR324 cluster bacterium]|nr:(2Fe-2S)-binding protein [SAR324 cluster bacterium]
MSAPRKIPLSMTVNGALREALVEPRTSLLTFLREHCALPGAKRGCEEGECGACVVLLEGQPVTTCLIFAVEAEGHKLTTIEGLGQPAHLAPIQQAFLETAASQCGFCIPGMLLSAHALLKAESQPDEARIRQALSGNLCRCTGYDRIVKAVKLAADLQYGHR